MVWNSDTHDCSAAPDFEFQAGSKAMTAAGKELQTKQMAAELSSLLDRALAKVPNTPREGFLPLMPPTPALTPNTHPLHSLREDSA